MVKAGVFNANKPQNKSVAEAVTRIGGAHAVASIMGVSSTAVLHWIYRNCPAERCVELERLSGVPREQLRPDIFSRD